MTMDVYVALDIGGTKILAAAADGEGKLLRTRRKPTPASLDEGLGLLKALVRDCASGARVRAIGAAIGGPLDWKTGTVSPLHQPAWRAVPLRAILEEEFRCPFAVDVDTNAAALGEWRARGRTPRRLLYLTISTGMGGGFVVDGALDRGANGEHPEVAHQVIGGAGDAVCECGARGCLEERISGNGIRRRFGKPAEELTTDEWAEVGRDLGQGLRNLVTILAPDLVAIGGGVAVGGGERLFGPARETAAASLRLVALPPVELSVLGYDTALQGALALAMERT
jgi:predicted NBD/HSP70 family sugar kinase